MGGNYSADSVIHKKFQAGRDRTREYICCGMFTVLIAVGAFIKIPVPVVPFTLQFFFTTMAGLVLGGKHGAVCTSIYMLLGLTGLPVFAQGGGLWYVLNPTFGYILGFCGGSYVTGKLAQKQKHLTVKGFLAAGFAGLFTVYAVGMVYYYILCNYVIHTPIALWPLFLYCFLLAVPGDIVLCILAALAAKRIKPALKSIQ